MDQNQSTVAFLVTHINSPEAARVWVNEKHKQDVLDATLYGLLERIASKAKASRATAEFFKAERDEERRKVESVRGTIYEGMYSYSEGHFSGRMSSCLEEAEWLQRLAKDLRQVLEH